jgi:hypothetical protein
LNEEKKMFQLEFVPAGSPLAGSDMERSCGGVEGLGFDPVGRK